LKLSFFFYKCILGSVWLCDSTCFSSNFKFFFLLKLSAVCTFWIILMCWYQKWFLKNKKTSLTCISARKAIWKATTTTPPNTFLEKKRITIVSKDIFFFFILYFKNIKIHFKMVKRTSLFLYIYLYLFNQHASIIIIFVFLSRKQMPS